MLSKLKKDVKLKLLSRLLYGVNVSCNICDHSFSTFLPYLGRINAMCPNCGSLERMRLIYYFMQQTGILKPGMKVLHIAPEKCLSEKFAEVWGSNYIRGDKFEPGYKYPPGTVSLDVTDIQFPDETFDLVICIHVLEHVQDDAKALSELYRVIKKGGAGIIQVPYEPDRAVTYEDPSITDPAERKKHFLQTDHVRIYGADYIQRFLKPGFKMEHGDFVKTIDPKTAERYVFKENGIFLLRKPA